MKQRRYPTALTIAGSDSGGGAGIQADLKTFSSLGVYGCTVITAVTAQNTCGVRAIQAIDPAIVEAQAEAVLTDIRVDAVKLGMLLSPDIIRSVADVIGRFAPRYVITDPVMVATSGDSLIMAESIGLYKTHLFPHTTLLTPNTDEASALTGIMIDSPESLRRAGRALIEMGCKAILMKGGHLDGELMTDILMLADGSEFEFTSRKVHTANTHGTGCTLSSAIASYLALGHSLVESVGNAKRYIDGAIASGADIYVGAGHGPMNHLHSPSPMMARNGAEEAFFSN